MSILISLSPNTERDDIILSLKTLLSPWSWRQTKYLDQAKKELAKHFPRHHLHLTSSGRSAIYHALKAAGIGADDEVIIQAFTCVAVPAAVSWTGARPILADIDAQTYNLDPQSVKEKITPRTKAVIVQHTFGIPGPLKQLQALADQHNLLLIEDCAHALGAKYHGQPIGAFGDISILSFGRDKTLSSVFGGAILTKNANLSRTIARDLSRLPHPPFWWVKQQLLHPLIMALVKPAYFTLSLGKLMLIISQSLRLLSKAVQPLEKQGRMPKHIDYQYSPALARLLSLQLKKLTRYTDRRRQIAAQYLNRLPHPINISTDINPAWLRYPLSVSNPTDIIKSARQNNIMLGDWYNFPIAPGDCDLSFFAYDESDIPNAVRASQHVINLPTYPTMTDQQVKEVIDFIKNS